jgi:P-type conjugative transfer protein TrbJ
MKRGCSSMTRCSPRASASGSRRCARRTCRVIFATQSLADIKDSSIAPAIIESCASRIFLPNPQATEPQIRTIYEGFGLNRRQIEIVATAQPKRDYYYQSRLGNRLFDLDLGPAALAFAGASTPQDQRDIDARAAGRRRARLRGRLAAPSRPRLGGRPAALVPRPCAGFPPYHRPPTGEPAMKKRLIAAAIAAMLCTATAHAQWVVVDPTNLVQNTLTAIRTLEQINNQIQQLQNEAQMLMNQARNLASLPSSVVGQLRANLATTERLIAQARGLAYDVTNLDREFARLYPEQYAATVSGDQMYRDAQERWKNTLNGLQTTMQMQAQASQNLSDDESVLADLVGKSQSAEGALQAMQAMNQLLALQAKQSIQTQRLQITQDRAASLELARQAAATERAREVRRRFLGEGTPYTPQPVNFYGN